MVDQEYLLADEEEINLVGGEEDTCFVTKKQHDDHLQGDNVEKNDYQQGYQNAMIAFQRQLNLRNKDVIISNPQKRVIENKTSTSGTNKPIDNTEVINDLEKGKEVINKPVVNTEQNKESIPPQELPKKIVENKKDMVIVERIERTFNFKSKVAKIKISLPFDEICRNEEYRNQLIKMLKLDDKVNFSDSTNLQDLYKFRKTILLFILSHIYI